MKTQWVNEETLGVKRGDEIGRRELVLRGTRGGKNWQYIRRLKAGEQEVMFVNIPLDVVTLVLTSKHRYMKSREEVIRIDPRRRRRSVLVELQVLDWGIDEDGEEFKQLMRDLEAWKDWKSAEGGIEELLSEDG